MKKKPTLFLYCQHSDGIGHLRRSVEIARTLVNKFKVVFFNGGRVPAAIPCPEGVEIIDLPPMRSNTENDLIFHAKQLDENLTKEVRRQIILEKFNRLQPDVILIELFPFGRKDFAFELLPLLRQARRSKSKPLVICNLEDILIDGREDQQHFDNRASWIVKRYFDAVLMHTDPAFARLEETFSPRKPLTKPVLYTGFVTGSAECNEVDNQTPDIVVSAGGGNVGAPLFQVAVQAQPRIWQQYKIPMTIVAGPFLHESEWERLNQQALNVPGLKLHRSVPELRCLLSQARLSVSQCGYNTTMDLLKTQVPALLIPFAEASKNVQNIRALKLEQLGVARVLAEVELNVDNFIREIDSLLLYKLEPSALRLDGASQTLKIISQLLDKSSKNVGRFSKRAFEIKLALEQAG